jgi:type IV secretory pathway TraG/TraD family ATPase VirD4
VIQTASEDTIDFSRFRKEKIALFICNPIKDLHYYKPLSALFFESLFNEIMSRIPTKNERGIFCILEEAATMKFSSLGTVISNIRKYMAGIMLVVQDYQALVSLYGPAEAHNIRTNTYAQVYLKGQPIETCKELETILGRFTYTNEKGAEKVRLLMSADEIRKSERAIILCGNEAPIKARMTAYYDRYTLRKRSKIQPYQPPIRQGPFIPPLIPI